VLVLGLLSEKGIPLSMMVKDRINTYPSSGEINFTVSNPVKTIEKISNKYASDALNIDKTDGISFEFLNWRFNLRSSNTEPVIRLNVESKGDLSLLKEKTEQLCRELTGQTRA
jgi:phosphomannomutase